MPDKGQNDHPRGHAGQIELIPTAPSQREPHSRTWEREAFVQGLFQELSEQVHKYLQLTGERLTVEARLGIVERNLRLTRDHLTAVLSRTDEDVPPDWQKVLHTVRFVGMRLGDACVEILKEQGGLTTQQLVDKLNGGQFRFRSGSPLRETNAALIHTPNVKKDGDVWIITGVKEDVA